MDRPEEVGPKPGCDVTLIIPNWNGREHLDVCLRSVARQSSPPRETILVDNGSNDDSVDLVRKKFPWVTIIPLTANRGFAAAVNAGIRAATGEYVALLNNDTELDAHWLEVLEEAMRSRIDLGSAACKMLDFEQRAVLDAAGDMLTPTGVPFTRGYGEPDDGRYGTREEVFGACAGAAIYRRDALQRVGEFDEDFVSYYEDADMAFRLQLAGLQCLYVPEAICYHKRNATGGLVRGYPLRMQERNLPLFYAKDFPWQLLLSRGLLILAALPRRYWKYWRRGVVRTAWEGFAEGMTQIPAILKKRASVQALRRVPVRNLKTFLVRKNQRGEIQR